MNIIDLPLEIWELVISHLDSLEDLFILSSLCNKQLCHICEACTTQIIGRKANPSCPNPSFLLRFPNLKHLDLYYPCPLFKLEHMRHLSADRLIHLRLGFHDSWNSEFNRFRNLQTLHISGTVNLETDTISNLPRSLTHITFGPTYIHTLDSIPSLLPLKGLPPNLRLFRCHYPVTPTNLDFCEFFPQSIENIDLCHSLLITDFLLDHDATKPPPCLPNLTSLAVFELPSDTLNLRAFPKLRHLFSLHFKDVVTPLLPDGIQTLVLPNTEISILYPNLLPSTLTKLKIQAKKIREGRNFPDSLTSLSLKLPEPFNFQSLPPSLEYLYCTPVSLPPNLKNSCPSLKTHITVDLSPRKLPIKWDSLDPCTVSRMLLEGDLPPGTFDIPPPPRSPSVNKIIMAILTAYQPATSMYFQPMVDQELERQALMDDPGYVKLLLQCGADVTRFMNPYSLGSCPSFRILELLLKFGAKFFLNDNSTKQSALHYAVEHSKPQNLQVLIKYGADLEAQDQWGSTPLHFAVKCKNVECAETLINLGARTDIPDIFAQTPISTAMHEPDLKMRHLFKISAPTQGKTSALRKHKESLWESRQ